ncbi:metallophosphoesterase [Mycolicibacterium smegmatis]|uniref:metallophosphoesterase family protein n=1 Tax=Mycolicibacterium smegmatis TaxID=1772 RepID=UPI001E5BAA39|nr:metallophosphoesterase [Mycolicibacterium smegmatis]UGU30629.1 metallophosphoesterase [Mycolicibacterium smegmatis]
MRLLHFADLHLDTPFKWAKPQHAHQRRRALRTTLETICRLAEERQVDALTCAGDLYEHDRFTPDTAKFLRDTFSALAPLRVLLAPGNHDWFGPGSLYQQVEWSDNVHVFNTTQLTALPFTEGVTIWGAAHCAPANTPNFLDDFQVDRGGIHIGLFHGSEQGNLALQHSGKEPHAPFYADQIRRSGLHHALLGHFHKPVDGEFHTYPGNPDPLSFGEDGSRGAVVVEISDDGSITRERVRVATTTANDVRVDVTGATHHNAVLHRISEATAELHGAVRVTLEGTLEPDVDLRLLDIEASAPDHLDALLIQKGRLSIAESYDLERLAEEHTVRGQFVRDVLNSESLTEEQRQRVLITGLRALDANVNELEIL